VVCSTTKGSRRGLPLHDTDTARSAATDGRTIADSFTKYIACFSMLA
jgi:hypothetical protein